MDGEVDRRFNRPRQSVGSIIGFATLGVTLLVAVITATLWIGGLDRSVTDMRDRMDKVDRENTAFIGEMRATFRDVTKSLNDLQLEFARQPNVPPRRR